MPAKNLFISLSDHRIFHAEKDIHLHTLTQEKQLEVGYNQQPGKVFLTSVDLHGHDYQVVYCALKHPFFVLIPESLYDADAVNEFLPGIDLSNQKIITDKISRNNVMCVYPLDQEFYNQLVHRYPNIILRHYASVMIDYTLKTGFTEQKTVAAIDIEDGLFYLCLAHKTDLLLCNKFAFKAPEDILYFLLYSLEQFGIAPASCQLHISGMVSEHADSLVLLKEYIEHVVIEEISMSNAREFKSQAAFFHQDVCV